MMPFKRHQAVLNQPKQTLHKQSLICYSLSSVQQAMLDEYLLFIVNSSRLQIILCGGKAFTAETGITCTEIVVSTHTSEMTSPCSTTGDISEN